MIVISDTSCLSAFVRIGELELLKELYLEVIIPQKVLDELLPLKTLGVDVTIFSRLGWLKVKQPTDTTLLASLLNNSNIDPGEAHSIALAIELSADWIILDDLNARMLALQYNLNVTGLGGVLLQAKEKNVIPLVKPLLDRCIHHANFRLSKAVYVQVLHLAGE